MRPLPLVLAFRLACLVAIAASAAMVLEYRNAGDPAFCGAGSGCFAVRVSDFSSFFGVPLPNLGLAAFSVLFAGSLLARTPRHHALLAAAATAGGVGAVGLLAVQGLIVGAFCAWCIAVDSAALVAAASSLALTRIGARAGAGGLTGVPSGGPPTAAWGGAAVAAVVLPFVWGQYPQVPPPPPDIAALQVPGKATTIVSFTDFQCPFCRSLHPVLHELREAHGEKVGLSRHMMPLSGHPGAMPAARAYVCSPEGKREEAATWLYEASAATLTPTGVVALADKLGVERAPFEACLASPETTASIEADMAMFKRLDAQGLPLTYVGARVVMGFNEPKIREAVEVESQGSRPSLPLYGMFVALGAIFLGAAAVSVARARREDDGDKVEPGASSPDGA